MNFKGRKVFLVFVILALVNSTVFSLELWEGFTDDMSRETVIDRIALLFGNNLEMRSQTNPAANNSGFTDGLQKAISWNLPMPELNITIFPKNVQNFPRLSYINFYFHESKLMYVAVKWDGSNDELLPILTRQFGRPITIRYTQEFIVSTITLQAYRWQNQGRDIFLDHEVKYFNQNFNVEYNNNLAERARIRRLEREEEEARRRNSLNDIQF
jgi:hypothetical protein